jgi:hypothetical protein
MWSERRDEMIEPPRHQDTKIRIYPQITQIMNFFAARPPAAEGGNIQIYLR